MKFPYLLRPDQLEALHALHTNDHLIYIAPTGTGKSILFQKYVFDQPKCRAILISPLNALSRQLADKFSALGIKVFHNGFPQSDENGVWIMSPEKLKGRMLEQIRFWHPNFLIVDEAHCVWEWGKEFRPAYQKVLELAELESIEKSLWCSATLPPQSLGKLKSHLKKCKGDRIKVLGSFALSSRMMLRKEKISPEIRLFWLRNTLGLYADRSGMVFCNTRASAVKLQWYLQSWGINSFFYHAGLSIEEKLNLEQKLKAGMGGKPIVVVATSAFGMGMDYPFFQFCILFEPPLSMLSLVQSIGRIGRQSNVSTQARAHILWHPSDFRQSWVDQSEVYEWCRSFENPTQGLENYFNAFPLSGRIKGDDSSRGDSYRSEKTH